MNQFNAYGRTLLMYASYHGLNGIVKHLLSHPEIDVNRANKEGTALVVACSVQRNEKIVKMLLEFEDEDGSRFDVNYADDNGTYYMYICVSSVTGAGNDAVWKKVQLSAL